MTTTQLKANGTNCGACVQHVTKALQDTTGVQSAQVDLGSGTATVEHDRSVNTATLARAVTDAGYEVRQAPEPETNATK